MQPYRRLFICASFALLLFSVPPRTLAKNLTITSSPSGARIEINGIFAGNTPFTSDYPGGYFHKPHTVFGARLDHAMVVTLSKDGYLQQKITITNGPFIWVSINGRHHGNYFLLKSARFDIRLEAVSTGSARTPEGFNGDGPMPPAKARDFSEPTGESQSRTGTVLISSNPSEAEIYVDGQFEGQTPATLRLASGLHHFVVQFSDDKKWERDLDVLPHSKLTLKGYPSRSH
jgi:hypothetical protein